MSLQFGRSALPWGDSVPASNPRRADNPLYLYLKVPHVQRLCITLHQTSSVLVSSSPPQYPHPCTSTTPLRLRILTQRRLWRWYINVACERFIRRYYLRAYNMRIETIPLNATNRSSFLPQLTKLVWLCLILKWKHARGGLPHHMPVHLRLRSIKLNTRWYKKILSESTEWRTERMRDTRNIAALGVRLEGAEVHVN